MVYELSTLRTSLALRTTRIITLRDTQIFDGLSAENVWWIFFVLNCSGLCCLLEYCRRPSITVNLADIYVFVNWALCVFNQWWWNVVITVYILLGLVFQNKWWLSSSLLLLLLLMLTTIIYIYIYISYYNRGFTVQLYCHTSCRRF